MPGQISSTDVHFHLERMSAVVERMATNSESSKTWCISLVSAIIVVASEAKNAELAWLSMLPIFMFFVLDVYYLSLERGFRASYSDFVLKLRANRLQPEDLYLFDAGDIGSQAIRAFSSLSIWPFYGLLTASIVLASLLLVPH